MSIKNMVILPRLPQETSNDYAMRILYDNMIRLVLEPGELLNDNQIAEMLGISRTPVREAFMCLRFQKLINSYPQSHSCVSKINLDYVDEGIFMRHALETHVLEEVLVKASSSDMARLQFNLNQQNEAISRHDSKDFMVRDQEFHKILFEIVDKPWCWNSLQQITTHHRRISQLVVSLGDDNAEMLVPYNEHRHIYDMIITKSMPQDLKGFMLKHIGYRRLLPILLDVYPHYFENGADISITS